MFLTVSLFKHIEGLSSIQHSSVSPWKKGIISNLKIPLYQRGGVSFGMTLMWRWVHIVASQNFYVKDICWHVEEDMFQSNHPIHQPTQNTVSLKKIKLDFLDKTSTAGSQHHFPITASHFPSVLKETVWKHTLPKTNIAPSFQDRLPSIVVSGAIILVSGRVPLRSILKVSFWALTPPNPKPSQKIGSRVLPLRFSQLKIPTTNVWSNTT